MGDEALEAHMGALLNAMKSGDRRAMATAFRAAADACYSETEPAEME